MSKKLLKSGATVATNTVLSRIFGLVREIVLANVFGASAGLDVFLVAFRIPNFLRRLSAEGAFSQAFVPVLSEYRQTKTQEETQQFVDRMAGTLALALFIVTAIAIVITPILVTVFAPGFMHQPGKFELTAAMLKITFPYLFFISLTAFASSILNSYDRFGVPAFTPVLLNVAMIAAALLLSPYFKYPTEALAWGVFFGGILQLAFQLPFLKRIKLLPKPKIALHDAGVMKVIKLMLPAIIGVSVAQIGLLIDNFFASFLRTGSITWLYFSDRLTNFPLGVFGIAIATVVLPHLSRKHADHSAKEFSQSLDWAIRIIFFIGIPSAIGLFMLSVPLFSTIFEHGKFNAFDVEMASRSLMAFAIGLPAFMLVKILATGFYSKQNIKTPVKIAIFAVSCNIIFNLILIRPLAHAGLALATTLAATINASLLCTLLIKRKTFLPQPGWLKYGLQLLFANSAMIIFLYFATAKTATWFAWSWEQRIIQLAILLIGSLVIYCVCLLIAGLRPKDLVKNVVAE